MSKKTKNKTTLPPDVVDQLKALGNNIMIARKRRAYTQEHLAQLLFVNRNTVRRLESGDPGISLGILFSALWVLQLMDHLKDFAHPDKDSLGLSLAKDSIPKRIRIKKQEDDYDF